MIRAPMPGMTRGFWRPGAVRSDVLVALAEALTRRRNHPDGFWYIRRSDDTLKVAGKRVGPAEVESAAVAHPAVLEAAAIGVPPRSRRSHRVVRPASGRVDDAGLRVDIARRVAEDLGKPLKPEVVAAVRALRRPAPAR